jgi:hypothetical protein
MSLKMMTRKRIRMDLTSKIEKTTNLHLMKLSKNKVVASRKLLTITQSILVLKQHQEITVKKVEDSSINMSLATLLRTSSNVSKKPTEKIPKSIRHLTQSIRRR